MPYLYLGLGWDSFGVCCVSRKYDFGSISEFQNSCDIQKDIFNSHNYVMMRELLSKNKIPDVCTTCSRFAKGGSLSHYQKGLLDNLALIQDEEQRYNAALNYDEAVRAFTHGETTVNYLPASVLITAGSGCNIRCKFCYNVHMNYDPDPQKIINIIDKVHKTLITAHVTGGEPCITKSGRAILSRFAEGPYKFAVVLGTNAQYTDFDLLKPVNLTEVQISTDGASKKVYESVRIGGNFEDLISNIKKFIQLKKEKPFLRIVTNYTVTSDNFMDMPLACKLYEDLGIFTVFNLVMREKDDPQNIKERSDLYDSFLKKIDEALAVVSNPFTKDGLLVIKNVILKKYK